MKSITKMLVVPVVALGVGLASLTADATTYTYKYKYKYNNVRPTIVVVGWTGGGLLHRGGSLRGYCARQCDTNWAARHFVTFRSCLRSCVNNNLGGIGSYRYF